ncbi:MAG TPA: thioredoxin [Planctomycetaceae bacterium]|nr:thioredoxin [Planctomycetaceae bacterium]
MQRIGAYFKVRFTRTFWSVWLQAFCLLITVTGCSVQEPPGPTLDAAQFDQDLNSGGLVLVKFGAKWCGPCLKVDPLLKELPQLDATTKVIQVDVDSNPDLASRFKVSGIPHLALVRGGQTIDHRVGYMSANEIAAWTNSHSSAAPETN